VIKSLKSPQVYNFILDELKRNHKIEKLLEEISSFVIKCDGEVERKTVESVFMQTSRELALFNNDIQQASYMTTLQFNNLCHLYALHLLWKKSSDVTKKESLKPLEELKNDKERRWRNFLKSTSNIDEEITEAEVDKLLDHIRTFFKQTIGQNKKALIEKERKDFKNRVSRAKVQDGIDR